MKTIEMRLKVKFDDDFDPATPDCTMCPFWTEEYESEYCSLPFATECPFLYQVP